MNCACISFLLTTSVRIGLAVVVVVIILLGVVGVVGLAAIYVVVVVLIYLALVVVDDSAEAFAFLLLMWLSLCCRC